MDEPKQPSLAQRLQAIGVKKSHAYMLANGERRPSMALAIRIHNELGVKLGPLALATEAEIKTLARVSAREGSPA